MEYVGFVSTVFTPTDLRKDRKALDAAREDGASRIRDTDGESLLLIEERRVRQLAQREEVSTAVTDLFSRLHHLRQQMADDSQPEPLLGDWTWLKPLDTEDWEEFLAEMWEAGEEARAAQSLDPITDGLKAWHETARALADPERMAALTAPFDPTAYVEIAPVAPAGVESEAATVAAG